ncbi:MAG: hypothetical protein C4519_03455 [Desulfobacteraceae bacterium]|nr:MAG: hypothetical protein C4519_03455 [Desulfobacteraceae bacterium]
MKAAITPPGDHHLSAIQRILAGSLTISAPEEFLELLNLYREDPFLHRKYADLLSDLKCYDKAAESYAEASELFIKRKMNLQAIVAKILQWSIQKASHHQGRAFYALLHEEGGRETPLQRFWARMSYPELVAVMRRLVRIRLKAGIQVTHVNEPAEELFFIVSGTLCEMPSPDRAGASERDGFEIETVLLGPNDVFGEVFPLHTPTTTLTEIRSLTDVELVKITKPVLYGLCDKYPRIGAALVTMRKPENRKNCSRCWQTVRRAARYGLPTKAEIHCAPMRSGQKILDFSGIAIDLSLGGMCMEITERAPSARNENLKGRLVQLKLDLLNEVVLLKLTGKIVWQHRRKQQACPAVLIGIRFDTLNEMDREMLAEYCMGSLGEQNLLWSLWETSIKSGKSG